MTNDSEVRTATSTGREIIVTPLNEVFVSLKKGINKNDGGPEFVGQV